MALTFTRSWADEDLDRWRDTCSRFVEQELQPGDEAARKLGNVGKDLWRKAGELGLLCTDIPETWGGGGGDFRHEAVIYEECSRRGLSGWGNSVHTIVAHYFLNHGTEEQRQRYLPRMARGEIVGAIAMAATCKASAPGPRSRAITSSSTAARPSSPTVCWPAWCWWCARPTRPRAPAAPRS